MKRHIGLWALAATGICSMIGASIHVVPFMIQKNVPGIGPYVLPAFLLAAVPALFAAVAYAALASAMPRAGGSYLFASRGLSPFAGFIASFSQWFGLSIAIGVISYIIVNFMSDLAGAVGLNELSMILINGPVKPIVALVILWLFVGLNIRGSRSYGNTLLPLMWMMFILGGIVIVAGLFFDTGDFQQGLMNQEGRTFTTEAVADFNLPVFLSAAAVLFASFIWFDSIAQAGGEAVDAKQNIPKAIAMAVIGVTLFYLLFTASVYHMVPWQFIATESQTWDISAPAMLGYVLPSGWTIAILAGATISLINDLPGMILSVSRLLYAWSADGIFPRPLARVHRTHGTPDAAILASGAMASIGILGSHFAGSFFLGIDIMVTAMLVNFMLMCITLLTLPHVNPEIGKSVTLIGPRAASITGICGTLILAGFLTIHIYKDLSHPADAWYFQSTWIWLVVMAIGSVIYLVTTMNNPTVKEQFKHLPEH
ncbi:MAG: APC family permease [Bacteroidota bacterium]